MGQVVRKPELLPRFEPRNSGIQGRVANQYATEKPIVTDSVVLFRFYAFATLTIPLRPVNAARAGTLVEKS